MALATGTQLPAAAPAQAWLTHRQVDLTLGPQTDKLEVYLPISSSEEEAPTLRQQVLMKENILILVDNLKGVNFNH